MGSRTASDRFPYASVIPLWFLAGILRVPRLFLRWGEANWDYASYHETLAVALNSSSPNTWFTSIFVGLQPPLHGLILAGLHPLTSRPALWMLLSIGASWLAVCIISFAGWHLAGRSGAQLSTLFLAVSPPGVIYAGELLNYPLLSLCVAGMLWGLTVPNRHRWGLLAGILAGWTHLLGLASVMGAIVFGAQPMALRLRRAAVVLVGISPLWLGLSALYHSSHVGRQPGLPWLDRIVLLFSRFGIPGILTLGVILGAAWGLRKGRWRTIRPVLGALLSTSDLLALSLFGGSAAPHQFQYLVAFGPIMALVIAVGLPSSSRRHTLGWVVLTLVGGLLLVQTGGGLLHLRTARQTPSGLQYALDQSKPGDAVVLILPHRPDDDKTLISPKFWALSPWEPMPAAHDAPGDLPDHRRGQPRKWRDRTIYVYSKVFPAPLHDIFDAHRARGHSTWLVHQNIDEDSRRSLPMRQALNRTGAQMVLPPTALMGDRTWHIPPTAPRSIR